MVLEMRGVKALVGGEEVLRGVDLAVRGGEVVVVRGRSGVGKTTLARVAALLLNPYSGEVIFLGSPVAGLGDSERSLLRLRFIGYVDQFHTLLPRLTIIDNVALPLRLLGMGKGEARERAGEVLKELGIYEVRWRYPGEVSGGQRQRAAIARALVKGPKLVVADEPLSNLDDETASSVLSLLKAYARSSGAGVLITTTDLLTEYGCDRDLTLSRGRLVPSGD